MDMAPPQAPPAIVSTTQQEAIDGLGRLVAAQAWLSVQQHALPALPAWPSAEGRDSWLASLDGFWQQPVADGPGSTPVPRVDALATRMASIMRDDAIVQRADGTLDANAAALAERFARARGGDPPPGIEVRSLRIGTVDYAGAVIVLDNGSPGPALRFMPDRGWHAFASLDTLHVQTEALFREELARRGELPGVPADDTAQVVARDRFIGSAVLQRDVFRELARRVVAVQREKVEDAWSATGDADVSSPFADEAMAAMDLHSALDIFALLARREVRLALALGEQRLASVPVEVAQGWREAATQYWLVQQLAVSSIRHHSDEAPLSLAAWSRQEITAAFARRQITADPDALQIEASGSEAFAWPTPGTPPTLSSRRMGVTEFALHNAGYYDGRHLRVIADGLPVNVPAPTLQVLREVAREANLAPRYERYLRERVSDPHGRRFRHTTMRLQLARMRIEAASARLQTFLDEAPAAFIDDRDERGYRMVKAILDTPAAATRASVGGHRIAVWQLSYQGDVVSDVLVIGARDARSSPRVVLYTPDAPDGRAFREFSDRATAAREFLYAPAFQEYLLRRLPAEHGEAIPNGSGRRFRVADATRRANWVLSAADEGRGTLTEAPFTERRVDGDVSTALFDAEIIRQTRDVAWLGRSTARSDAESIAGLIAGSLAAVRGPGAWVEETASAVGQALRATWRFYDSVKAGDSARAFVDFTEAYTSSLSLVGWRNLIGRATRATLSLRPGRHASRGSDAGVRLADARQQLESRYAVHGIDLGGTRPDSLGVHHVNGRRYIRQHGYVFELRHERASDTWRIVRPNASDAMFPGPAVEPLPVGGWRVRTDIGLRGGWVDDAAFPQARSRGVTGQELDGLSEFQQWTFQQTFARHLHNAGEAQRIYWQATSQPSPRFVTLRQRTAWNDALRTARRTPAEPLAIDTQPVPGASWRVVPTNEWPAELWHYPQTAGRAAENGRALVLPLQALPGSGLVGLPATTHAPPGGRSPAWIRLHLDRFRGRHGTAESPGLRIVEDLRGPEPTYVVQPAVGFPLGFLGLEPGDFSAGGRLSR